MVCVCVYHLSMFEQIDRFCTIFDMRVMPLEVNPTSYILLSYNQ